MAVALHNSWKQLLQSVNTSSDDEFKWTATELTSTLQGLNEDLADLEAATQAMAKNPSSFRLTAKDVQGRILFVQTTKKNVEAIQVNLTSPQAKAKLEKDKREALLSSTKDHERLQRQQDQRDQKNQTFIDSHSPQVLVARQDKEVDALSRTVQGLKHLAEEIGVTLDQDSKLLAGLEDHVDTTHGKLVAANKKADKLLKKV